MEVKIKRFSVYLIALDPTIGKEIQKTRPCVVISPDELNHGALFLVAPMTTKHKYLPTNIPLSFKGKEAEIILGQIRTIDQKRVIKYLGSLDFEIEEKVLSVLQSMFQR
jgi:mRNA interferase MazF